jgi:sodium transport system permease protein
MSWINVKLIFMRELRDQLRDRRTLFTIAILPLLLYPLLGMTFLQITQFLRQHPTRIGLIGAAGLPDDPPLLVEGNFAEKFSSPEQNALLELTLVGDVLAGDVAAKARQMVDAGEFDAVVYVPPTFASELTRFRSQLARTDGTTGDVDNSGRSDVPMPEIYVNTANEKSRIAFERVDLILSRWREEIGQEHLRQRHVPVTATRPFEVKVTELAEDDRRRAALWSKILPFVVLVWALTGAFYPAVDLCAGEQERGTLETLLTSPAQRLEIVAGKLLTVMSFSMATSLLNLFSMGTTGAVVLSQISGMPGMPAAVDIGPPPPIAFLWLVLALIPCSALFSALSLAIAAFAKSSREGQYYLMPLLLISLPLMLLPLLPSAELDLGTSLIPITGVLLILKSLIEGQTWEAARYFIPVTLVTAGGIWLAVRWAVHQFNSESVLFRESERFELVAWLQHLRRERGDTPTAAEALLCGVLLLMIRFFAGTAIGMPDDWQGFIRLSIFTQVVVIAALPVLMAVLLTRRPAFALSLGRPSFWATVPAAVLLAVALHPLMTVLSEVVLYIYPISERTLANLEPMERVLREAPLVWVLLAMAVAPAICEELAFRGFILSGFRRTGFKWGAIAMTSVLFGVAHFLLQQSILAALAGMVLGYIAVKTSSLWPAVAFHLVHNGTKLIFSRWTVETLEQSPLLRIFCQPAAAGTHLEFTWTALVGGTLLAAAIIWWLKRLPYREFAEEKLQEALDRDSRRLDYVSA